MMDSMCLGDGDGQQRTSNLRVSVSSSAGSSSASSHETEQHSSCSAVSDASLGQPLPKSLSAPCLAGKDFQVATDSALLLGKGSFGTVKVARDTTTGRHVALKRIRASCTREQLFAEKEFHLARRVSSVYAGADGSLPVVKPLAGYSDRARSSAERNYDVEIVYDLMRGGSLADLDLRRRPLPEQAVRQIMSRVLSAIDTMHKADIAHCDIKPSNVLLEEPGNWGSARICDFGLAHDLSIGKKMTIAAGTPQYFAPEVVAAYCTKGAVSYGKEVDLWAAGVLMYELLCGAKPFPSLAVHVLFQQIHTVDLRFSEPAWREISPEARELVRKLLTFCPGRRITAQRALKQRWFRARNKKVGRDTGGTADLQMDSRPQSMLRRLLACTKSSRVKC